MLLYIFATCCIMLSSGYKVPMMKTNGKLTEELEWPARYTVKATKMTLSSGLVEDFTVWRSNASSRIDYNNGAVKVITLLSNDLSDGDKYEIHPETTKSEYNEITCHNIGLSESSISLDTVLPDLDDVFYESVGSDYILQTETIKFVGNEDEDENRKQTFRTIWAYYDELEDGQEAWIPVKYEVKKYNNKLGALIDHYVYQYNDYYAVFDDDVFDIDQFDCEDYIKHDENSKAVTQELLFMDPENPQHVNHVFKSFKNKFGRQFSHEEHDLRRSIFQNSMRVVSSVNRKNLGYKLSINRFADRTPEEMKGLTGLLKRPEGKHGNVPFPYSKATLKDTASDLPTEYDLRLLGLVSPVKDQESCGSCWTFGTTAAVEGALARINGGALMSLANQAIIDCAWDSASGCDGGSDNAAYEWMMENGLPTEEEYGSYTNRDGYCNINNMTKLYPIRGYTDVTPFSTEALKVAVVNHGPLSVSVEVTNAFSLYAGGIFYEPDCGPSNLDHEVALVGYGEKDGDMFWILKNSWGPEWGIDGYMHIAARDNNCGVETEATYVVF